VFTELDAVVRSGRASAINEEKTVLPIEVLRQSQAVLVVDYPTRDVPEALARGGFSVTVHGGPGPEDYNDYELHDGDVVVRHRGKPPDTADLVYVHRPVNELPEIVLMTAALGARAIWLQSGERSDGEKDPQGCWLDDERSQQARTVVEDAGLAYVQEPYIGDVVRMLGAE
jgi:predicted CoA-binding protein